MSTLIASSAYDVSRHYTFVYLLSCPVTDSRAITKVKQHRTWSVGKWVTAWEYQILGCAGGIMDNVFELLIGEPSSNSRWVRYIDSRANTLDKPVIPSLCTPVMG